MGVFISIRPDSFQNNFLEINLKMNEQFYKEKEIDQVVLSGNSDYDVPIISYRSELDSDDEYDEDTDNKIGLFDFKRKGYFGWTFLSLIFPPISIFVTSFIIGRRYNEKCTLLKYLVPGLLLTLTFVFLILEILGFGPRIPTEYLIYIILLKSTVAIGCFSVLTVQRRNFIKRTKRNEHYLVTFIISKLLFPFSFAQMALDSKPVTVDIV